MSNHDFLFMSLGWVCGFSGAIAFNILYFWKQEK